MSNNIFADIARKETTISPLVGGKTKTSIQQIRMKYPDGITLTQFDLVSDEEPYAVFTFAEDPDAFAFGGQVLTKICLRWLAQFQGDMEATNEALAKAGGVRMRFDTKVTKNNRTVTTVEVLS